MGGGGPADPYPKEESDFLWIFLKWQKNRQKSRKLMPRRSELFLLEIKYSSAVYNVERFFAEEKISI